MNGNGVLVAYTNDTAVWCKDEISIYNVNLFISGEYARMWQNWVRRFGQNGQGYADEVLALAVKEGLKQMGGLASFDEEWSAQGYPGLEDMEGKE